MQISQLSHLEQTISIIGMQLDEFATVLHRRLFMLLSRDSQAQSEVDMNEQINHVRFGCQIVCDHISDRDALKTALQVLEKQLRHQYTLRPESVPMIGAALVLTLRDFLGHDWNLEAEVAWVNFCADVSLWMSESV